MQSEPFTYTVARDSGADVLVIADEDVTGVNPDLPGRHDRPEVPRRLRGRTRRQRHQPRHVGRRQPGGAAPARRARPLRRGDLGARRQPPHPGSRGRAHRHVPVRTAARPGSGREGAVPDDGRPGLPQRGRQAAADRRDHRLLRPARRLDRRHLLRPRRRPRGGLRRHRGLLQRLPAAGRRLPPVLVGCLRPNARSRTRPASPAPAPRSREPRRTSAARPWPTTRWTRPGRSPSPATSCRPNEFPLFAGEGSSTYLAAGGVSPFAPVEGEQYAGAVHVDRLVSADRPHDRPVSGLGGRRSRRSRCSSRSPPSWATTTSSSRRRRREPSQWTTLPEPERRDLEHATQRLRARASCSTCTRSSRTT